MTDSAPASPPRTNPDDYAVLIGVSRYAELNVLEGPVNDVAELVAWLTDAYGGGLPHDNITVIVSDESAVKGKDNPRPTLKHVEDGFYKLIERVAGGRRIGRRLYLYMSGHGYLSSEKEVALLLADASPERPGSAISVTAYANYFRESGAFDEVVLFADCDQTHWPEATPAAPPWREHSSGGDTAAKEVTILYVYGAQQGHTALEDVITSPDGQKLVQGLFTRALVEGLSGAAAASDGSVTSDTLTDYLLQRVKGRSEGMQSPYSIWMGHPVIFVPPTAPVTESDAESEARRMRQPEQRGVENERVSTQSDDPATTDELGRRPFAEVIAARIEEVWQASRGKAGKDEAGAFMVHIHGPWGSGKTSVLNFLKAYLQDKGRAPAQRWVVVEYNAWRNQRIRPPWWTLIKDIYSQSARQLGLIRSLVLRAQWLMWRIRADLLPALTAVALVVLAVLLATGVIGLGSAAGTVAENATGKDAVASAKVGDAVELGVKILSAALAAVVGVFAFSRSLVFGSARAAQTYSELKSDPLGPIVGLFKKLVKAIHRPVLVLVDDMDRCDGQHVIELLEGIQTLFRNAPVTYVVAADRKWICSSFEKGFADFGETIGEPGRPLGYLFLDKVFQVSASIPRLSPTVRYEYWRGLLRSAGSVNADTIKRKREEAESYAKRAVNQATTQEELEEKIAEVRQDPVVVQAVRAAAARRITSPEAQRTTEHLLQGFAGMLEPNPRSMKRLVNAFGLKQATQFLEGRNVPPEVLARWTIIELRWPLLADFLAARPQFVVDLAEERAPADGVVPDDLKKLFGDALVREVVTGDTVGRAAAALNEDAIRRIVGMKIHDEAQSDGDAPEQGRAINNRED